MPLQYLIFSILFGLALTSLLELYIGVSIRLKGYTPFYQPNPKDSYYAKVQEQYRRRSSTRAILVKFLSTCLFSLLTFAAAGAIVREKQADSVDRLLIFAGIVLFCFIFSIFYATTKYTRKSTGKPKKKDTWQI
jgi:small neutral amino acid transporter SnatA (MarC family)